MPTMLPRHPPPPSPPPPEAEASAEAAIPAATTSAHVPAQAAAEPAPGIRAVLVSVLALSVLALSAGLALQLVLHPDMFVGGSKPRIPPYAPGRYDAMPWEGRRPPRRDPLVRVQRIWQQVVPVRVREVAFAGGADVPDAGRLLAHPNVVPVKPLPTRPRDLLPAGVIPWDEAAQHVGQTVTVQGWVADTYFSETDRACFLSFNTQRTGFHVLILREALEGFPRRPDELFLGRTIRVTGKVFQRGPRTQIRVYEPAQIVIVP